jgi:two-component sensor histidine kinase
MLTGTAAIIMSRHQQAEDRVRAVEALRASEDELRRAVVEREALLKELHHRVKNNLQVLMSLLEMQADGATHPAALATLAEARRRVAAIASMHELLHQKGTFSEVDLCVYSQRLIAHVISFYQKDAALRFSVVGDGISIDLARAVPIGLLLNELVSNACKHAFPDDIRGEIELAVRRTSAGIELSIKDTGVGLPEGFDCRASSTLGLQLVEMLAKQLGGTVRFESGGGTTVQVFVPMHPKAR